MLLCRYSGLVSMFFFGDRVVNVVGLISRLVWFC